MHRLETHAMIPTVPVGFNSVRVSITAEADLDVHWQKHKRTDYRNVTVRFIDNDIGPVAVESLSEERQRLVFVYLDLARYRAQG